MTCCCFRQRPTHGFIDRGFRQAPFVLACQLPTDSEFQRFTIVDPASWVLQLLSHKAMELQNEIPEGSVAKLKKQARGKRLYVYKNVQMLANATQYIFSLDKFLPAPAAPDANLPIDALERKPTLIFCADEEGAQQHDCNHVCPCSSSPRAAEAEVGKPPHVWIAHAHLEEGRFPS